MIKKYDRLEEAGKAEDLGNYKKLIGYLVN